MSWIRLDLSRMCSCSRDGRGGDRVRRIADLRDRLLAEAGLTGAAALSIERELRVLLLEQAAHSLH